MKKSVRIIFVSFLLPLSCAAQSIAPQVMASSGETFAAGNTQLSLTIGEPLVETYSQNMETLTQGFHQPDLLVTEVQAAPTANIDVNVFPNPTASLLNISTSGKSHGLRAILFDMNGKMLQEVSLTRINTEMQIGNLAASTYILQINNESGSAPLSYLIQKTN